MGEPRSNLPRPKSTSILPISSNPISTQAVTGPPSRLVRPASLYRRPSMRLRPHVANSLAPIRAGATLDRNAHSRQVTSSREAELNDNVASMHSARAPTGESHQSTFLHERSKKVTGIAVRDDSSSNLERAEPVRQKTASESLFSPRPPPASKIHKLLPSRSMLSLPRSSNRASPKSGPAPLMARRTVSVATNLSTLTSAKRLPKSVAPLSRGLYRTRSTLESIREPVNQSSIVPPSRPPYLSSMPTLDSLSSSSSSEQETAGHRVSHLKNSRPPGESLAPKLSTPEKKGSWKLDGEDRPRTTNANTSTRTPSILTRTLRTPARLAPVYDTPAFPRLVSAGPAETRESIGLIKDAEMSFSAEADSYDGFSVGDSIASCNLSIRLEMAEAKAAALEAERDQAFKAASTAKMERDEAKEQRDEARATIHLVSAKKLAAMWNEVIRAGNEAIEEEKGVRAMIKSYRAMIEPVNS